MGGNIQGEGQERLFDGRDFGLQLLGSIGFGLGENGCKVGTSGVSHRRKRLAVKYLSAKHGLALHGFHRVAGICHRSEIEHGRRRLRVEMPRAHGKLAAESQCAFRAHQ